MNNQMLREAIQELKAHDLTPPFEPKKIYKYCTNFWSNTNPEVIHSNGYCYKSVKGHLAVLPFKSKKYGHINDWNISRVTDENLLYEYLLARAKSIDLIRNVETHNLCTDKHDNSHSFISLCCYYFEKYTYGTLKFMNPIIVETLINSNSPRYYCNCSNNRRYDDYPYCYCHFSRCYRYLYDRITPIRDELCSNELVRKVNQHNYGT